MVPICVYTASPLRMISSWHTVKSPHCFCLIQVMDWIENHGEAFLSKHTGVGKSLHRARALQKRHDDFEDVAQVSPRWFVSWRPNWITESSVLIECLCFWIHTANEVLPRYIAEFCMYSMYSIEGALSPTISFLFPPKVTCSPSPGPYWPVSA